jgi:hypothetical protein
VPRIPKRRSFFKGQSGQLEAKEDSLKRQKRTASGEQEEVRCRACAISQLRNVLSTVKDYRLQWVRRYGNLFLHPLIV